MRSKNLLIGLGFPLLTIGIHVEEKNSQIAFSNFLYRKDGE
jgi:hypothetical protein